MSRPAAILRLVELAESSGSVPSVGDIVRTGENRYPHYEVIAVSGGRAWVRNVQYGDDHVVPVASIHRI
jgi:hypothetical protein